VHGGYSFFSVVMVSADTHFVRKMRTVAISAVVIFEKRFIEEK